MADFAAGWVQTRADYDLLFARVVRFDWATRHRPVLTTCRDTHTLYTGVTLTEPDGLISRCHQQCGVENRVIDVVGTQVEITCTGCSSISRFPRPKQRTSTVLDKFSLVKTPFPQGPAPITWEFIQQQPSGSAREDSKPARTQKQAPTTTSTKRPRKPQKVQLQPPTILTRSTSVPTQRVGQLSQSIPSPTPAATIGPETPPAIPPGPQPLPQPHQTVRTHQMDLLPPAMMRSHSAPQMTGSQGAPKRADRPTLDFETPVLKRQKRR